MKHYLEFSAGGMELCIDMAAVVSIEQGRHLDLTAGRRMPAPEIFVYRSAPIPLWHLSTLIDPELSACENQTRDTRIMVITSQAGRFALCVDRTGMIFTPQEAGDHPMPPVLGPKAVRFCPRVLHDEDSLRPMVDPERFQRFAMARLNDLIQEKGPEIKKIAAPVCRPEQPDLLGIPAPAAEPVPHDGDATSGSYEELLTRDRLRAGITRIVEKKVRQQIARLMSQLPDDFDAMAKTADLKEPR